MRNRRKAKAAFTLAEIMVVIVIIGVLAALLLPALVKGRDAAVRGEAQARISDIGLALDSFYNAFGFYPPTNAAFNPATGAWDHPTPYGDYAYSEALVHLPRQQVRQRPRRRGPDAHCEQYPGLSARHRQRSRRHRPAHGAQDQGPHRLRRRRLAGAGRPMGQPLHLHPADRLLRRGRHIPRRGADQGRLHRRRSGGPRRPERRRSRRTCTTSGSSFS